MALVRFWCAVSSQIHEICPGAPSPGDMDPSYIIYCLGWCGLARLRILCRDWKTAIEMVRNGLSALKVYKANFPHDARYTSARLELELALARAYVGEGTDRRLFDKAVVIFQKFTDEQYSNNERIRALKVLGEWARIGTKQTEQKRNGNGNGTKNELFSL